ncbi:MAG: hypothetical protein AAF266_07505 [Planctomycetota bacterium]
MSQEPDLHELVDALSDRSITEAQLSRLNGMLETDQTARYGYLNLMRVEAELGAIHQSAPVSDSLSAATIDAPHVTPRTPLGEAKGQSARWFQLVGVLAASLALVAVGSSWLTYEGVFGRGPLAAWIGTPQESLLADQDDDAAIVEPVARVAATRNCRWSGGTVDLGFGAEVAGGQLLELETGLAELTFADGARLVLEGPAAFKIPNSSTVELYSGRVAAAIPEEAAGFSVRTNNLVVSEAGAQYGIYAGKNGADEVHVFEGAVEAKAIDRRGRVTGAVTLASLEGARLRSKNQRFAVISADDEGFVRSLDTRTGPGEGLLAFDNFAYPTGPVAWQNGGFGWAGPWADLEAAARDAGKPAPSNGVVRGSIATPDVVALGNRFVQSGNSNRVRRTLSTSIGGVFDAAGLVENVDGLRLIGRDGSSIYVSFLQRVSKTNDIFYGVELHRGDGNFNRVLCVGNGVDDHGYGITSTFWKNGRSSYASLGEENTDVNLIVLRIDFGEGDDDLATVFRNPSSLTDEESCEPTATLRGMFAFDRVSLSNFEGDKIHEVDEVRIGTSFRAVTGRRATPSVGIARTLQTALPLFAARLN